MLKIDTSDVQRTVLRTIPTKRQLQTALRRIGSAARGEWVRLAGEQLHSTKRDYVAGISNAKFEKGRKSMVIELNGPMPNMVEHGWSGGDMRVFLATGHAPNAKQAKDGHWYNHIPFRHGSPGTKGRNVGKAMPRSVHRFAKGLGRGQRIEHAAGIDEKTLKVIRKKERGWHASGRFEGMVKSGGYMTFRTISQNNPRGWIHPGIRARHLIPQVQRFVQKIAPAVIEATVNE